MKQNNLKKYLYSTLIYCTVLFSCVTQAQQVATEVLDDVTINRSDYNAVIKILFKRPLAYLSHSPANDGNTINIRVNLLGALSRYDTSTPGTESINVNSDTGLNEVIFERVNGTSGSILLYFSKDVSYEVIQGSDQRSLSIVIYGLD